MAAAPIRQRVNHFSPFFVQLVFFFGQLQQVQFYPLHIMLIFREISSRVGLCNQFCQDKRAIGVAEPPLAAGNVVIRATNPSRDFELCAQ